ncbi:hypothetical protein BGZ76_006814 [Entomortierella beljakovae]|nr:hypothetical protein BGZ76_006814 [Entomortierella beljakovae]
MTPKSHHTKDSKEIPYPDNETDYQDYGDNASFYSAHSRSGSRAASVLSLTTSVNSMISLRAKKLKKNMNRDIQLQTFEIERHDSDSFGDYEYDSATKPYRKPFYRRKRFWLKCSIFTVLFLAIFVPIFVIIILPKVAQAIMNGSTMAIDKLDMINPRENSVQVSVTAAILGIPSMFAATVEFQEPVQVYWQRDTTDQPRVGQMNLDTINKKAFAKAEFTQSTVFEIADPQLFGEFAKTMLSSENFVWRIVAKINVVVLGRTIKDLSLDKTLILDGLRNFANLKILSFDIPSDSPDGTGALVSIKVSIPNDSPIGMSLGTMTIDMNLQTAYLGRITAKNVVLVGHQPTILLLEGTIKRQTDPTSLRELSSLISNYLSNTPTTAFGQGVSVFPDGINPVSWITTAILATKMSIPLLPPTPLNVVKQININDISLLITPQQPWQPTASSTSIAAAFQLPFNLSLLITDIWDPVLTLGYQTVPFADITTAVWNKNASDMVNNNISLALPASPMVIRPDAHDAFGDFLISVSQQDKSVVDILGSAKSTAITSVGQVNITVPFNTTLDLQGISLNTMRPQLAGIVVSGATTTYLVINATVDIQNPSIFGVDAGPVTLHIKGSVAGMDGYMGDVIIPNLKLVPGANPLQAQVHFMPKDTAFRDEFMKAYITGNNFDVSIYGDASSSAAVSLAPIMENMNMKATLPGMNPIPRMVVGGNGNTTVGQFLDNHQVMIQVQILNPLATELWVQKISANVTWQGYSFGNINMVKTFPIKASSIDTSPLFYIQIPSSYEFWVFLVTRFIPQNLALIQGSTIYIDLDAFISATVGGNTGVGYEAGIAYSQKDIGVFLKIEFSLDGLGIGKRRVKKRGLVGDDDGMEESFVEESFDLEKELGPAPDKSDMDAYLAWLKKGVRLSFPEEAAADDRLL